MQALLDSPARRHPPPAVPRTYLRQRDCAAAFCHHRVCCALAMHQVEPQLRGQVHLFVGRVGGGTNRIGDTSAAGQTCQLRSGGSHTRHWTRPHHLQTPARPRSPVGCGRRRRAPPPSLLRWPAAASHTRAHCLCTAGRRPAGPSTAACSPAPPHCVPTSAPALRGGGERASVWAVPPPPPAAALPQGGAAKPAVATAPARLALLLLGRLQPAEQVIQRQVVHRSRLGSGGAWLGPLQPPAESVWR